MAKEELPELENRFGALEKQLKLQLIPKDPNDEKNVILEIRPGAGGDEAGLFAEELFRAYSIYASSNGWKVDILNTTPGSAGE